MTKKIHHQVPNIRAHIPLITSDMNLELETKRTWLDLNPNEYPLSIKLNRIGTAKPLAKKVVRDTTLHRVSCQRVSAKYIQLDPQHDIDEESDGDLTENKPDAQEEMIKYMERARNIIDKYKTKELLKTQSNTRESWLVHTIRGITHATDRVINPSFQ